MTRKAILVKLYKEGAKTFKTNAYVIHEPDGSKRLFSCGIETARIVEGKPYKVALVDQGATWGHLRLFTGSYAPEWLIKRGDTLASFKKAWATVPYFTC